MRKILYLLLIVAAAVGIWHFVLADSPAAETIPVAVQQEEEQGSAAPERKIVITDGEHEVVYALNDSSAAADWYWRLPQKLELQNYSDNEKIIYPGDLNVRKTPRAKNQPGTLAYYAPWKDVVMFYGPYRENDELYELGHVVQGEDEIPLLQPGMVTIDKME